MVAPGNCCEDFEKAQKDGTDNEGWGALLGGDPDDKIDAWFIGTGLNPIKFCPWCGFRGSDMKGEPNDHR